MTRIADWMCDVLEKPEDEDLAKRIREQVRELCQGFQLPYSPPV